MTKERYDELMSNDASALTAAEISAGWHFCTSAFDGLLVGPPMDEKWYCGCEMPAEVRERMLDSGG